MKYLKLLTICVLFLFITAFTPPPERPIPPTGYNGASLFHSHKNAYLILTSGENYGMKVDVNYTTDQDILGDKANKQKIDPRFWLVGPGPYQYVYDKKQQNIFMQSLQANLIARKMFRNVELRSQLPKNINNAVLIAVDFIKTEVNSKNKQAPIILIAKLMVQDGKHIFTRTYKVYARKQGIFYNTFRESMQDVSQQMMQKIMAGLAQYNQMG